MVRVVKHEGAAHVLMSKAEVDDMKDVMEEAKRTMLDMRRKLQAAPRVILEALDEYGGIEDSKDRPENYENLLYVARVAMASLDKELPNDG